MRRRRMTGILSVLAAVAAAGLAGISLSFFSSTKPNGANQFQASSDFSSTPTQGSAKNWSGFADFSVGLSATMPSSLSGTDVLGLAHPAVDVSVVPVAGSVLTPSAGGAVAQTFAPSVDQTLGSVDVWLSTDGPGPVDDITVSIRSVATGLPAGPDLVTATVPAGAVLLTPTPVTVAFTPPLALLASQTYAIVLQGGGVAWQVGDPYSAGAAVLSADGVAWAPTPNDLAFQTRPATGGPFVSSGTQTSEPFDVGRAPDQYITLSWLANVPPGTVRFQLAAANTLTDTAIDTFLGPDGTAASYYLASAGPIWSGLNGRRFIRYRAYLDTSDPAVSPTLQDVAIKWDSRPPPPTSLAPNGAAPPQPTFTWAGSDPDGDALTYLLQVAATNDFARPLEQRVKLKDPTYILSSELPPGIYFWRVATFDGILQGDWSDIAQITVT